MHKKLQLNLFYLLIMTGLLSWGGLSFSQDPKTQDSNPTAETQEIEEHDTQDLEKLLKRYNTDSEKVLEDSGKIHNIQQEAATTEVKEADIEEMRPSYILEKAKEESIQRARQYQAKKEEELQKANASYAESVRVALEPLQKLSEAELLKRLDEGTKESPVRPYMDQFPNITLYAVRLIKDKESIPSVVKIVENKERLIQFGSVMLFTIIFGFILKRIMHREGRSFIKATFYFLIRVTFMMALRIGVVYYFYAKELTPAAKVFKKTFL